MNGIIFLTVSALFYTLINTIIFFKKKKINKIENKIYTYLLLVSIVSMVMELSITVTTNLGFFGTFIQKTFLAVLVVWLSLFLLYTFVITLFDFKKSESDNLKKYRLLFYILLFASIILISCIFILPIYFNSTEVGKYTYGPSVDVVFKTAQVYTIIMSILLFLNFKKINRKGYLPIITFIILLILTSLIQKVHPEMLITNAVFGIIVFLMYHTIENPDVKMVSALNQNRILIEKSNEEKSNLLFKVSQEVKRPIYEIEKANNVILNSSSLDTIKHNSLVIGLNVKNLMSISDSLLDISKLDFKNIKIDNSDYNVINLFNEIKAIAKNRMKDGIDFRFNVSKIIPEYLYGDRVKLKQVVSSLLFNSIKYTSSGFIELEVNSIIKYDVCRLMISVSDSGKGIDIVKINEILSSDTSLTDKELERLSSLDIDLLVINKVVKMLNGTLIIRSEKGKGSEFLIIIDQKIKNHDIGVMKKVEKYSREVFNHKRVLVIDDDIDTLNRVGKILEDRNYEVIKSSFGQDCMNIIKNSLDIDIILLDDANVDMSALDVLKMLKNNHVNIPVLVMLSNKKEFMKEHYLNDGFRDYIIKEKLVSELNKLDKYV